MADASGSDVQLSRAERPWKARRLHRLEEEEGMDPEERQTQEILRHVRSVLNKLTPQKFNMLMKQLSGLPVKSERLLRGMVEMVVQRAVSEPQYSVVYANMCRCFKGLKVPSAENRGRTLNFHKLLLYYCKMELQSVEELMEKRQVESEASAGDQQKHLEELEKTQVETRRRLSGIVRFMGELFKMKMVSEAIVHDCIVHLLKKKRQDCLCVLLSTTGKQLDTVKSKSRMDQYFNQMEKIIKNRQTSNRIRFMLQDVIDLRESNWVPKRSDLGPQTISEIRIQATQESLGMFTLSNDSPADKREPPPISQKQSH